MRIYTLFGRIVDSYSGILGSKAACAYPKLIAACHALHRFLSQGIHYVPFGRIVLLGSFGVILPVFGFESIGLIDLYC